MTDRKPGAPGKCKAVVTASEFTKLQRAEPFSITLTRDDAPIAEGTPYSKAAVLPDNLAAQLCPNVADPTPADAFRSLYTGKAPTGFGLGSVANDLSTKWGNDANNATACGWYGFSSQAVNTPFPYGVILTSNRLGVGYVQLAFSHLNDGTNREVMAYRSKDDATTTDNWSPWQFINPPLKDGVEYATVERYKGQRVYTKRIDVGALPNAANKVINVGVDATKIIRCSNSILTASGYKVQSPYMFADGTVKIKHEFSNTSVNIITTADYSGATANFQIWYTK